MIDELNREIERLKAAGLDELIEIRSQKKPGYLRDTYTGRKGNFNGSRMNLYEEIKNRRKI
jgi:hypothetical protein